MSLKRLDKILLTRTSGLLGDKIDFSINIKHRFEEVDQGSEQRVVFYPEQKGRFGLEFYQDKMLPLCC